MKLTIGTRGSRLALTQTHMIRDLLIARHPDLEVQVDIIQTRGDVTSGALRSFGGQGVFTKEIENALLERRVDLAVHSLKDLPTSFHADLQLVATPPREDVRDVLITRQNAGLDELPRGAVLGTGSQRRRAQLLALRPDLELREIRGNLDTRIAKVREGEYDGTLLAAAGMHRLGWQEQISAYLETERFLPAVGQAALGLQMRRDSELIPRVEALNHPPTFAAITAERSLMHILQGGCHAPIAAWGRLQDGAIHLDAVVGHPDGSRLLRARDAALPDAAAALGERLAEKLRAMGADEILAELES